jgi:hypothetical protein
MNSSTIIIKPDELVANLEILRGNIARKPDDYIPQNEFPRSIGDSLSTYTRTRHVNVILAFSDLLRVTFSWPFPFFVLFFSNSNHWMLTAAFPVIALLYVRIMFESLKYQSTERINNETMAKIINHVMVKLVRLSCGKLFCRWKSQEILANHQQELDEIRSVYIKGYWYPCVTAIFPLLDHVCRKLLKTRGLQKGVGQINRLFKEANINLESLRPGSGAWDYAEKIGANAQELSNKDLRLVGVALESFLRFAEEYYSPTTNDQDVTVLNRHAVLHGARGRVWTGEDATRLLLFLDLMIILVPVFEILLATNSQEESNGNEQLRHGA